MAFRTCTFLEVLAAIFLPPLGVFLRYGCCRRESWICLLLAVLGWLPSIVYAVYLLVDRRDQDHCCCRGDHCYYMDHCCRGDHCYREEYFAVA